MVKAQMMCSEALNNVAEKIRARLNRRKSTASKEVNAYFAPVFNNLLSTQVMIQRLQRLCSAFGISDQAAMPLGHYFFLNT